MVFNEVRESKSIAADYSISACCDQGSDGTFAS